MGTSFLAPAFAHHVWATLRVIDTCLDLSAEELETSVPGIFVAGALALTVSVLFQNPGRSSIGLLLIVAGLPFYQYWRRRAPVAP
jgi:hypothetical protein